MHGRFMDGDYLEILFARPPKYIRGISSVKDDGSWRSVSRGMPLETFKGEVFRTTGRRLEDIPLRKKGSSPLGELIMKRGKIHIFRQGRGVEVAII